MNLTDPTGKCPWCVGAIIGGALDAGIQLATIAISDDVSLSDFSFTSVAVSAGAGALGVGIASNISKLGKLGTLGKTALSVTADAGVSAGSTAAKGGDVTLQGVALDVIAGQTAGKALGKVAGNKVAKSSQQKIRNRQADRLQRIGDKPNARPAQKARADASRRIVDRPIREAEAKAGLVGSNAASGAVNLGCTASGRNENCK